jgi:sugar porter (SP) family MFS transporter
MEERLAKKYNSQKAWLTSIHAVLGSLIFSYNIGVFTSCQPCVAATLGWGSNAPLLIAVMSSLLPLGAMFGALMVGLLSKRIGRRQNMIYADLIIILASIVTVIPTTPTFAIGRFLSGIGIGKFSALVPLYLNEISPSEISGRTGSLMQLVGCIGSLFAFGFALALPTSNYKHDPMNNLWIGMFLFQGLVACIQLMLFFVVFKYETAPWLLTKGKEREAQESLGFIYMKNHVEEMLDKLQQMKSQNIATPDKSAGNDYSYGQLLCCAEGTTKAMRLGLLLSIIQQLSGINAILSYATTIFGQFGSGVFISRVFTMISGFVKFIACFGLLPFIDKTGRKKTLIFGCIGMAGCLGVMGFFSMFPVYFVFPFLVIELYLAFFVVSIGPICWVYSGEILTSRGMSICTAVNWFSAFLVVLFFPFMIIGMGPSYTFWFFAFINIVGSFYFGLDMIETKGMMKHDIRALFSTKR